MDKGRNYRVKWWCPNGCGPHAYVNREKLSELKKTVGIRQEDKKYYQCFKCQNYFSRMQLIEYHQVGTVETPSLI